RSFRIIPADPTTMDPEQNRVTRLVMRSNLADHVRLVDGRLPSPEPVDGVYEALVTDNTLVKFGMVLGTEVVSESKDMPDPIRIRPVGVIAENDLNDMYWDFARLRNFDSVFIIDDALFQSAVAESLK